MPKPITMGMRWAIAWGAGLAAGLLCCPPAGAVVGGAPVSSIEDAPYQVALIRTDQPTPLQGQWCGGIVRDPTHIITAAHCVFDNVLGASGQPVPVDAIDVFGGNADLRAPAGDFGRFPVAAISIDNDYDPATFSHDAAVITLRGSIQENSSIQHIELADSLTWQATQNGSIAKATVTGWGRTSGASSSHPPVLQISRNDPLVSDDACAPAYDGFDRPAMQCAGSASVDACFGDSGGPLVVENPNFPDDMRLIGIVSFGPPSGCAVPGYPGGYTEVYSPDIRSYLLQPDPASAPRTVTAPSMQGTPTVGSTVTCDPGTWDGQPDFTYQFVVPAAGGNVARTAQGAQRTYTVQPQDAGSMLRCDVEGRNAGGFAYASSVASTVPVPEQPPAQQPPDTGHESPSQNQQDTAAPVARVTRTTCTSTRCTLTVSVTDAGFSAGIKTVTAAVRTTYRTTCRKRGRKVPCTRQKNGRTSVAALSATRFQIVASRLPVGKQVFTLFAVDKAGHRQALPTTKTVTTKKPKKHR